jgi:hypothetical protein
VLRLPAELVPHADQARARADEVVGEMLAEVHKDLEDGIDPTALWWTLAHSAACCDPSEIAAALASTLLRLAVATR